MRRSVFAIALVASVLGGCSGAPAPPSLVMTGAPPSVAIPTGSAEPTRSAEPTGSVEPIVAPPGGDRLEDLDELVAQLARHPEPYIGEDEATFTARVDAVRAQAAAISDIGFLIAVMDLTGHRDQDGHTGTFAIAQQNGWLSAWPLWLWDFPDGWRVIAAGEGYDDMLGARVTAIGGTDPKAVAAAVEPLVPRDNPSSLRANLPLLLTIPEILEELGFKEDGAATMTVETIDGETRTLAPDALPITTFRDWIFGVYGGQYPVAFPPDDDGPAVQRNRDRELWTEPLDGGGLYVGYNDVVRIGADGTRIDSIAEQVDNAAAVGDPVVIDLRNNPGGDNGTFVQLRQAVEDYAEAHPGRIALLTGRGTFSAAGNFVTDLETGDQADAVTLVGESPGGGLNVWGNVRIIDLPNSAIRVIIGTRPEVRAPGDPRIAIPVDVPAEATWDDVAAGRDPVLDAALAAIAEAGTAD